MNITPYLAPFEAAASDPLVVGAILFVGAGYLATYLQSRKNAQLQHLGTLIQEGAGTAYKLMTLRAQVGGGLTGTALLTTETEAIAAGVSAVKLAATKAAGTLPDDATLATRVSGTLGTLLASDPTVSAFGSAVATAVAGAGDTAEAKATGAGAAS